MLLSFSPRGVLPERRADGAALVPGGPVQAVPPSAPAPYPVSAPPRKKHRHVPAQTKNEVLNFYGKHSIQETLQHFTELSESTVHRIKKDEKRYVQTCIRAWVSSENDNRCVSIKPWAKSCMNFTSRCGMPKERLRHHSCKIL